MDPEDNSPRAVLARNLNTLMAASKGARRDLSSPQRIQALSGFSKSQVDRIRGAKMGATVDSLGELAAAFALHPWQLLAPKLEAWQDANRRLCVRALVDVGAPPQSENLKRAHAALRVLTEDERKALVASMTGEPVFERKTATPEDYQVLENAHQLNPPSRKPRREVNQSPASAPPVATRRKS